MKEYESVITFLNGCAGAAHPQRSFEEAQLQDPADYVRAKHSKDFHRFQKEVRSDGITVFTFDNGTVSYIYEFTEL